MFNFQICFSITTVNSRELGNTDVPMLLAPPLGVQQLYSEIMAWQEKETLIYKSNAFIMTAFL